MTNPICPICNSPTKAMPAHPEARLFRCSWCTHAFTEADSISAPEAYEERYFEDEHKNWFRHPDVSLFGRILRLLQQKASVLDVGCGRGDFLRFLSKARPDLSLTGLDLSANQDTGGIRFLRGDILGAEVGERFDAVVALQVIEHVADAPGFVKRLRELAKPQATVIVSTPREDSLLYRLAGTGRRLGVPLAFDRLYSKHHLHHFTSRSLEALMARNRLPVTAHWHHNAPLEAMDIPVKSKLTEAVLRCGLRAVWVAGQATGRTYLQTVICTGAGSAPLARG